REAAIQDRVAFTDAAFGVGFLAIRFGRLTRRDGELQPGKGNRTRSRRAPFQFTLGRPRRHRYDGARALLRRANEHRLVVERYRLLRGTRLDLYPDPEARGGLGLHDHRRGSRRTTAQGSAQLL